MYLFVCFSFKQDSVKKVDWLFVALDKWLWSLFLNKQTNKERLSRHGLGNRTESFELIHHKSPDNINKLSR